jgi:hypothetical protein
MPSNGIAFGQFVSFRHPGSLVFTWQARVRSDMFISPRLWHHPLNGSDTTQKEFFSGILANCGELTKWNGRN